MHLESSIELVLNNPSTFLSVLSPKEKKFSSPWRTEGFFEFFSLLMSTNGANYVFIMTFLLISLGYLILLVLAVCRVRAVFARPSPLVIGKVFYALTILLCAFSVCSSVLLIIESSHPKSADSDTEEGENYVTSLLYNVLYISDAVFVLLFFNLFWFTLIYSYKSHIRIGDVLKDSKNPPASNRGMNFY